MIDEVLNSEGNLIGNYHKRVECVMNKHQIFNSSDGYFSYTCNTCADKPENICSFCMNNCHKNHKGINETRVEIRGNQCLCALRDHHVEKNESKFNVIRTDQVDLQCTLNEVINESNVKYFYIDPISHMYYCLYCLDACQGVLSEALDNFIKREKSKISQGAPLCSCGNKESHSPFHENIICLSKFILSPVFDKILNRVQLPWQIYAKPSLCEKYLDPIKNTHYEITLNIRESNSARKYKTELVSKSYISCLQLLKTSAEILKKDTNLITNPNIQNIYNINFILDIFHSKNDGYCLVETKTHCLYFYRKFYLIPSINYKKWQDGLGSTDNINPFHRLLFKLNLRDFFRLLKLEKSTFLRLIERIHTNIIRNINRIEEKQIAPLIIEYLKWIIMFTSLKFDEDEKYIYYEIINKFVQLVNAAGVKKSYENILKKYFEIFIYKVLISLNDDLLFSRLNLEDDNQYSRPESYKMPTNNSEYNSAKRINNRSYMELLEDDEDPEEFIKPYFTEIDQNEVEEVDLKSNEYFAFEDAELQHNLIRCLFIFGKEERDNIIEIEHSEIYDLLVNTNDLYSESIDNFIKSKFNKENIDVITKINLVTKTLEENVDKYLNLLKGNIEFLNHNKKKFYEANMTEKELIEGTLNICQITQKYLASIICTDFVCANEEKYEKEKQINNRRNFISQLTVCKIGFLDMMLNMWYILSSNEYIYNTINQKFLNSCLKEIINNLNYLIYDNPLIASIFFNRNFIELFFETKHEEERDVIVMDFYYDLLCAIGKGEIELDFIRFLEEYNKKSEIEILIEEILQSRKESNVLASSNMRLKKLSTQISTYTKILKSSSSKSIDLANNLIATKLKYIITSNLFTNLKGEIMNEDFKGLILSTFKAINSLKDTYFTVLVEYIPMIDVALILTDIEGGISITPATRRILTKTYCKYSSINPFKIKKSITLTDLKLMTRHIDYNLISRLIETDTEFRSERRYIAQKTSMENFNTNLEDPNPEASFIPLITNMEKYKIHIANHSHLFKQNLKFFVKYFTDVILIPCIYSVYILLYFTPRPSAKYKYLTYKIVYLFIECYRHFINVITIDTKMQLISHLNRIKKQNFELLCEFFDLSFSDSKEGVVGFMLNEMDNLISTIVTIQSNTFEPLKLDVVMQKWTTHVKKIKIAQSILLIEKQEYFVKKEENKPVEHSYEEVYKKMSDFLTEYLQRKSDLDQNLLVSIFKESNDDKKTQNLKKTIALDLLFRINAKEESTVKNYFKRSSSNIDNTPINRQGKNESSKIVTETINNFTEENVTLLETINKLFKADPDLFQNLIKSSCSIMKNKINNLIRVEMPYLLQFILNDFHRLEKLENSSSLQYFLHLVEFFRLFCENHHKIYQTFFTFVYIKLSELDFFDFILNIPVIILSHLEYFKKKKERGILKFFRSENTEYFNDIITATHDFLIELIQGAFDENFNAISAKNEFVNYYEFVYRFFDSIDQGEEYEIFLANFLRFITCYLDENTNSSENKTALVKKFKSSKLMNVIVYTFKKMCFNYLSKKKEEMFAQHDQLDKYNIPFTASRDLLKFFVEDESMRENRLFVICSCIFKFMKTAVYFKSGEKIKILLENLKKISEINFKTTKVPEKNKNSILLKRELYKFLNSIIKEVEVSYKFSNKIEDIELIKYRNFFEDEFFEYDKIKSYIKSDLQGIQNVIYVVNPESLFVEQKDLIKFRETAPFENFNIKLNYIIEYYDTLFSYIQMRKKLLNTKSKFLNFIFYLDYTLALYFSVVISILINGIMVISSFYLASPVYPENLYDDNISTGNNMEIYNNNEYSKASKYNLFNYGEPIAFYISLFHLIGLILLVFNWLSFNVYKITKFATGKRQLVLTERIKKYVILLLDKEIFPLVWNLLTGLFAILHQRNNFAYSLQLFTIFTIFPTMQSVIYSVQARYKQFLSAALLIGILLLFYASVSFFMFNDEFFSKDLNENLCSSFLHCFLTLLTKGIRGGQGIGFSIKSISSSRYWSEFIFEWVFYFTIILIMLNVINGIIVDTFQALREQNNLKDDIKENVCYICSLNRSTFEIKGINYHHHTVVEHSVLNYFHYLLKVKLTDEQDLNSLDYYVLNSIKEMRTDFFPIKKAFSLQDKED